MLSSPTPSAGAPRLQPDFEAATIAALHLHHCFSQKVDQYPATAALRELWWWPAAAHALTLGAAKHFQPEALRLSASVASKLFVMDEFHPFGDLPEPLRAAIFATAWRDTSGWHSDKQRKRLRLVCRQACSAVDGVVHKLSARAFFQQDPGVVAACIQAVGSGRFPALRELCVGGDQPPDSTVAALVQALSLPLQKLSLWGQCSGLPAVAAALAGSTATPALREVAFIDPDMDAAAFCVWAEVFRPCLEVLNIRSCKFRSHGAAALAGIAAAQLPQLRELDLSDCALGNAGAQALAQVAWVALEVLNLSRCGISREGAAALAAASIARLPALRRLHLSQTALDSVATHLGEAGIEALLQCPWPRLQELHLSANSVGVGGAAALASAATRLPALRKLGLSFNRLSDSGVRALVQAPWGALEVLELDNTEVGASGARALARASKARLPALRCLTLRRNKRLGTDAGIEALARHPWPHLEELGLEMSDIGAPAAAHLAAGAHNFPRLTSLSLHDNRMGAVGISALLQSAPWPCLECLSVNGCDLDVEGMAALAAASRSQLPALRELTLAGGELCAPSVAALAQGQWRRLELLTYVLWWDIRKEEQRTLHLSGVEALVAAGAARFPALRRLEMDGSNMPEDHLAALIAAWPDGITVG